MEPLALLVTLALLGATLPLWLEVRRSPRARVRRGLTLLWVAASLGVGLAAARPGRPSVEERTVDVRPLEQPAGDYVSSDACRACHPGEYDSWHDTYHRTMADVAGEHSVQAPFDGRELTGGTARCVPFKRGEEFWVELVDPYWTGPGPAPVVERQVVQTTGSHHQQLYWFATGHTRALGLLPYGYRIDEGRWRPIEAIFLTPPRGAQSTTLGRWNTACQKCHATHGQARFEGPGEMDTRVTELGIACEMCHGPAAEHVARNRDPLRRYRLHGDEQGDATVVEPSDLPALRSGQVCGQCHGVMRLLAEEKRAWVEHGLSFRPGDDLFATRSLQSTDDDPVDRKFWKDGVLRVAGREYNSLERTPCFQAGAMTCLSCHRMHQGNDDPRPREVWRNDLLAVGMDGDRACTQCHDEFDAELALRAHTHHEPASAGSRCLDCHMPYTTYGLMGAIRNHEVQAPDVGTSLATGRPNACNQCHLDRSLGWTARWMSEWYGAQEVPLDEDQQNLSAAVLWTLQGDAGQRALMAWSLGWETAVATSKAEEWRVPYLALLMEDPYHTVRFRAHRSLGAAGALPGRSFDYLDPPERRGEFVAALLERWNAAQAGKGAARSELLLGPEGRLDEGEVERLLRSRDESDLVLQE